MTALEFQASMNSDGTFRVPQDVAAQLKAGASYRVLLLVPADTDESKEEDEAWDRLGEAEMFRGYSESDSIYDDV
jgi:hypothetical protein